MSGYADQTEQRRQHILRFALRILDGPDPAGAVERDRGLIETISVSEVIALIDDLVRQEIPMSRLKVVVNKLLNLFHASLSRQGRESRPQRPLLTFLSQNNRRAESVLDKLRPLISSLDAGFREVEIVSSIREQLQILLRFCLHYSIKENAIFPRLEVLWPAFGCLSVMWSFHDDIRQDLKETLSLLNQSEPDRSLFNRLIGRIFFNISAIVFREEMILFPHMLSTLSEPDWQIITQASLELEWPFELPGISPTPRIPEEVPDSSEMVIDLGSGRLDIPQLTRLFRHLPLDLTLVDENDRVLFFSEGKNRIFPRSRAIIGRLVQNCHPPESLAAVEEIIRSFRSGASSRADFWIDMPQGKVLIRYIALRDDDGRYRGVLEISQEIGEIQTLEGERRLPSWSKA